MEGCIPQLIRHLVTLKDGRHLEIIEAGDQKPVWLT